MSKYSLKFVIDIVKDELSDTMAKIFERKTIKESMDDFISPILKTYNGKDLQQIKKQAMEDARESRPLRKLLKEKGFYEDLQCVDDVDLLWVCFDTDSKQEALEMFDWIVYETITRENDDFMDVDVEMITLCEGDKIILDLARYEKEVKEGKNEKAN